MLVFVPDCEPAITNIASTGSGNTRFLPRRWDGVYKYPFFHGHLPQISGFCLAKQMFIVSFATQARARILSDRDIFCTLRGGGGDSGGVECPWGFSCFLPLSSFPICFFGYLP